MLKSTGLLARYRAGVRELYDWFVADFAMAVLLLEGTVEDISWPEEVRCDPRRLLESFTTSESVKAVYGEVLMSAKLRPLEKILSIKPEPQTTPALGPATRRESAVETVQTYKVTAALRSHLAKIFDTFVHRKGQGFWVQAEYGAGKTHFLAALIDLLIHRAEGVWDVLRDTQLRDDYASPLSKVKLFPVAFSLKGMGEAEGFDSLMRVLEEQVRESLRLHAPAIEPEVKVTSAELAAHWYKKDASEDERAGLASFFAREHKVNARAVSQGEGTVRSSVRSSLGLVWRTGNCEGKSRNDSPSFTTRSRSSVAMTGFSSSSTSSARGRTDTFRAQRHTQRTRTFSRRSPSSSPPKASTSSRLSPARATCRRSSLAAERATASCR